MSSLYNNFYEPFPREIERQVKKGGTFLTYIPISEVITRLNKVVGIDKWDFEVKSFFRDANDPDFIVAHVTLKVTFDDGATTRTICRDGVGGQKIKRTKQGDIVDLGDEMKGAVSDALKKASQTLGIGLYLARSEEALEADIEEQAQPKIDPEVAKLWENFIGLSKSLNAEQKSALNDFWVKAYGGKPKPSQATATTEELNALIAECVRLSFNATASEESGEGE
jgi:recombination DNA repair RAD52 pathway protein